MAKKGKKGKKKSGKKSGKRRSSKFGPIPGRTPCRVSSKPHRGRFSHC